MKTSSGLESFCFGIIVAMIGVGVFLAFTDQRMFEHVYVLEDGLIEWLTVLLLLISMVTAWVRAAVSWKSKNWWFRFCLIALGLLFFFGAGEEISWGQRFYRWMAPQYFFENNTQQETTLHNLVIWGIRLNKVIFGTGLGIVMGAYLLVLPTLYQSKAWVKKFVDSSAIPLVQTHQVIFYVIVFLSVNIIPSGKKGELFEFAGVFLFWLVLLYPKNKSIYK